MDFRQIAEEAGQLEEELGISFDDVLHKLTQEFGELNDAIQKYRGRYCRSRVGLERVKEEAGDSLFNLISVCYRLGIDPNELLKYAENTLENFKEKKDEYLRAMKKREK